MLPPIVYNDRVYWYRYIFVKMAVLMGGKRLSSLKKITVCALIAAVVFQLVAFQVLAVLTPVGNDGDEGTVRIHLADEAAMEQDFVKIFPALLYLGDGAVENPLRQTAERPVTQRDEVPNYDQSDYTNTLYGNGTVATSGSSVTALAMAATYLTGYSYSPDLLARWFAGKADNDVARVSFAAQALGLPFAVSEEWNAVFAQLKAGKLIIAQTDERSVFAADAHFVVLKGMTEDGKILVNDPNAKKVTNESLKEKYVTGFEETEISSGFCYAWIFDESEVPADIGCYADTAASDGSRYASLGLTPAEKQMLARLVCVSADGECEEGQQMLIEVILNRMLSADYPNELKKVVFGEDPVCDVSLLNDAQLTQTHYMTVERALYGPYKLDTSVTDFTYICHR